MLLKNKTLKQISVSKKDSLNPTFCEPKTFVGKSVMDYNGKNCGKIKSLYINPQTMNISGVKIKNGFHKDYLLTREYFEKFSEDTLYLNTIPIKPNDKVVDLEGKKLGKIKDIHRNPETNRIQTLEVKSRLKPRKMIPITEMIGVGDKITVKRKK